MNESRHWISRINGASNHPFAHPSEWSDKLCVVQRLIEALKNESSEVPLDVAALELASIEFPGLDIEASLFRLQNLADQLRPQITESATGLAFIGAMNEFLFDVLQFRGNDTEYYDPRNSCLNAVLNRRVGIPISLSVLYMELARRLQRQVHGIGLPGHFVVMYEDEGSRYWIDPFHGGRVLSYEDCCAFIMETAGVDLHGSPMLLTPVPKRQILIRMLSNLKAIYLEGQALEKAKQVLDLLISAMPDLSEEYRQRGLIHLKQLNHRAAKEDLERYLQLAPQAPEREEVEKQLILLQRWKAGLN